MIRSMTGYGRGKYEIDSREYTVEIKAINHRYNDISIRMPRYLMSLEDKVRSYISKNISRGKIDVFITLVNMSDEGRNIKVDRTLAGIYISESDSYARYPQEDTTDYFAWRKPVYGGYEYIYTKLDPSIEANKPDYIASKNTIDVYKDTVNGMVLQEEKVISIFIGICNL